MKPAVMYMVLAAMMGGATASPLAEYVDRARVLVISAPSADDPALRRQDALLGAASADLRARDVVVVRAVEPSIGGWQAGGDAAGIRTSLGLPAHGFGVALVGKDGGVKFKRRNPVTAQALFSIIDAMPMRRAEMRRGASE